MKVERDYACGVESIVGEHSLAAFGPDLLAAYRDGAVVAVEDVAADPRFSDEARTGLASRQVAAFVEHYNHARYHESLGNLTPADVYFGRGQAILTERERIKRQTIQQRRLQHQLQAA